MRHLFNVGVPLFVHWDYWSAHFKGRWCLKPAAFPLEAVPQFYSEQAVAELLYTAKGRALLEQARAQPPAAVPAPDPVFAGGWNVQRIEEQLNRRPAGDSPTPAAPLRPNLAVPSWHPAAQPTDVNGDLMRAALED